MDCLVYALLLVLFIYAAQSEELWRTEDLQCGWKFKLSNGKPSACNPDSKYPCCNEGSGWCGNKEEHCGCSNCKDYRRRRCGSRSFTVHGEAATCDPASSTPCCSEAGICGSTDAHCKHKDHRWCYTKEYELCKFPFKYGDKVYSSCSTVNENKPWCATKVNADLTYDAWDYCQYNCKPEPALVRKNVKTWPVSDTKGETHWLKTITTNTKVQMQARLSKSSKWQSYIPDTFAASQHWHNVTFGTKDNSIVIDNGHYGLNVPKQGNKINAVRFNGNNSLYWTSKDPADDQWLKSLENKCAKNPESEAGLDQSEQPGGIWESVDWWLTSARYPSFGLNVFLLLVLTVTLLYYKQNLASIKRRNVSFKLQQIQASIRTQELNSRSNSSTMEGQAEYLKGFRGYNNISYQTDSGTFDKNTTAEPEHANIAYEDDNLGNSPYKTTGNQTNVAFEGDDTEINYIAPF